MKNIFKSLMLVAVAAMGFACQETMEENYTPTNPREVVMTIIADADEETRTYISDEANGKIAWSEGDQLKVIENSKTYRTTTATTIAADGKAQFAVSFPANTSASEFTYNAVFPATALVEDDAEKIDAAKVKVIVKDQQKPTATSFDPKADILVSKQLEFDAQPTELNMQFKRLVALGKMTIKGLPEGAEISQVVFTAGASDVLAGRNYVDATTGKVLDYGYYGKTNILTITYDAPISTRDIYFVCNPFEMETGDKFSVVVKSGDDTYATDVEIPVERSLVFTEGNMSTFSVTVAKQEVSESAWMLVTDVNDLAVGDEIIIAAKDYNYALSTVQNSNNRGQAVITKDGDNVTFGDAVQVLTLEAGIDTDTFAFNTGSGYLHAASSSKNYLRTQNNVDANASWKIEIASTGVATIKAQGANTNNWLRYNSTNTPPIFSCYGSGQADVVIYKNYVGGGADVPAEPSFSLSTKLLEFDAEGGSAEINVVAENNFCGAVTAIYDAEWLTIVNDDYTFTITADANEDYARTATITFSAEGAESVVVTVTQKAKPTEGETQKVWLLVTNASDLAVGDEIIIAAKDYNFALSTDQKSNNRGQAAVTKNDNNTIDFDSNVQILTLEEGTVDGTFAFYTGDGYLYAASSKSNHLKTQTTNNANGSWSIAINSTDGTATVVAKGDNTRNTLQYNESSSLFSCYTGASQDAMVIYKLVGEYTPAVPAIDYSIANVSIEADATSGEAIVTATNADGWNITAKTDADWITDLQYTNGKITFSSKANDGEAREAKVTVTAAKEGYDNIEKTFTITQSKFATGDDVAVGTPYSYEFTAKQFSANGTKKLGDLNWTLAGDGGYWGLDGNGKGQQFGSGSKPYKTMTLKTSDYQGGVTSIKIKTSGASSINATFTVTVGGTQIGEETKLTTTSTEYTLKSDTALSGDIVISYTQTSSKAIYIKSIAIN